MNDINDNLKEDREGVKLPKDCKKEKDFIRDDNDDKNKKVYSIEKNKANMINHINTISKMTDENYYKFGSNLERKYEEYSSNADIPEHVFAIQRYKFKLNSRLIDNKTDRIRRMFENILSVKSRILDIKLGKDGKPKGENNVKKIKEKPPANNDQNANTINQKNPNNADFIANSDANNKKTNEPKNEKEKKIYKKKEKKNENLSLPPITEEKNA